MRNGRKRMETVEDFTLLLAFPLAYLAYVGPRPVGESGAHPHIFIFRFSSCNHAKKSSISVASNVVLLAFLSAKSIHLHFFDLLIPDFGAPSP